MVVSHNDPNAQVVLLRPIENNLAELNPKTMQIHRVKLKIANNMNKMYLLIPRFNSYLFLQQHIGQHFFGRQTQGH